MTTTTRDAIVCDCGNKGSIKCRENDQPYSNLREEYCLEGFDGGSFIITNPKEPVAKSRATTVFRR